MPQLFESVPGQDGSLIFKFNGQFALKNYNVEIVNGNRLKVTSATNELFSLLEADVSEVEINGMIYSDAGAAQIALQTLVYSNEKPIILTEEDKRNILLGIVGTAEFNTQPSTDKYERWAISKPGTYINFKELINGTPTPITVTPEEFNSNTVILSVTNGIARKELYPNPKSDLDTDKISEIQIISPDRRFAMFDGAAGHFYGMSPFTTADYSRDRNLYKIGFPNYTAEKVGRLVIYDQTNKVVKLITNITLTGKETELDTPILIEKGFGFIFRFEDGSNLRGYDCPSYGGYGDANVGTQMSYFSGPNMKLVVDVDYHLYCLPATSCVTPQTSCIILSTGSSLTAAATSYSPEQPTNILNNFSDVNIYNIAVGGRSMLDNINAIATEWNVQDGCYFWTIPMSYIMFNNCANGSRTGENGFNDLKEALNLTKSLGAKMLIGSEEDYGGVNEYFYTYRAFAEALGVKYSPIGIEQSKCYPKNNPYTGFTYSNHYNYRGRAAYFSHLNMLKSISIDKSIKLFRVRPPYKSGSPTIADLMYDNNDQRAERYLAINTYNETQNAFKPKSQDNLDNNAYDVPDSTYDFGSQTEMIDFIRGNAITFNKFALIEAILDKLYIKSCNLQFRCDVSPSKVYMIRKANIAVGGGNVTAIKSAAEEVLFTFEDGIVKFKISGENIQQYDKVRILVQGSGEMKIAQPVVSDYVGEDKVMEEVSYKYRKIGSELNPKTSLETGWTLAGTSAVDSFPSEIANYTSYNVVKSHMELKAEGDFITKSIPLTGNKPTKIAIRIVAQKFNKIATTRYNGSSGALDPTASGGSKYVDNVVTVTPGQYEYGKLAVTVNGQIYKECIIMQGWHESYFEVDLLGSETSIDIKIEKRSLVDASYTNHLRPILIHDVSVQSI
ncbi:hypothetical protein CMU51_00185 [Elizabethkingia anophelis]|uniref:Uncharacterized protein n=1 Tax=Elizabethkingia anophelis TaxID=1117645 RepID=A0AAE4NYZ9_9FLAO|nr:hypothetical protein [Elizabethkingia anophelis]